MNRSNIGSVHPVHIGTATVVHAHNNSRQFHRAKFSRNPFKRLDSVAHEGGLEFAFFSIFCSVAITEKSYLKINPAS